MNRVDQDLHKYLTSLIHSTSTSMEKITQLINHTTMIKVTLVHVLSPIVRNASETVDTPKSLLAASHVQALVSALCFQLAIEAL